jgi:Zn-dependent M28 family amino/carboxypeptidase
MLSAHWDTRPVADMDELRANRGKPILGANDGASGVAALLEIARVLYKQRPEKTIVFAFWDGEDLGEFCHGSTYFAKHSREAEWKRFRAKQGILLDMIGDADLELTRDLTSIEYAPQLWDEFHAAAAEIGKSEYFNGPAMPVIDDHVPLNKAGIPTIDLIDFDYPYWHTVEDTPDKCSPASLKVIGDCVLHFIRRGEKA